jgi:hypothetical protein
MEHHGKRHELRWVVDAVLGETRRHPGQADIIGERIDGRTGR